MEEKQGLAVVTFASRQDWESWLDRHHATSTGLWLKLAKKGAATPTLSYAEAVAGALCYGWIDGQKASYDQAFWLQRFTPRGPRSRWSRINRDKAVELIEGRRMKPPGLSAVERARADGRWDQAYEAQSTATVPEDLQRELDAHPGAAAFFATLNSANRYAILYRVQDARRPETRARRIQQFVAMLDRGEQLYP